MSHLTSRIIPACLPVESIIPMSLTSIALSKARVGSEVIAIVMGKDGRFPALVDHDLGKRRPDLVTGTSNGVDIGGPRTAHIDR